MVEALINNANLSSLLKRLMVLRASLPLS